MLTPGTAQDVMNDETFGPVISGAYFQCHSSSVPDKRREPESLLAYYQASKPVL